MFYDSRTQLMESEIYKGIINQKKSKNSLYASIPPTKVSKFKPILNYHGNDTTTPKIPFKYDLNDVRQRLSNNSPKFSLHNRSKIRSKSSSSTPIRVQSSNVSDNAIKSLDITSYSFHSNDPRTNSHLKISKSDSQLSRIKISANKSFDQNQKNSSDGYVINKIIRRTFHSKNEIQKIKLDESSKQDFKTNCKFLFNLDEEKSSRNNYRNFLKMKFSNNQNLKGDKNETQICLNRDPSKLYYELAFEQSKGDENGQKRKVKFFNTYNAISYYKNGTKKTQNVESTQKKDEISIHEEEENESGKKDEMSIHEEDENESTKKDEISIHEEENELGKKDEMSTHEEDENESTKKDEMSIHEEENESGKKDEMSIHEEDENESTQLEEEEAQ